jgi:hypothetical protein
MSLVLLKSMSMLVQGADAQYSISPVALLLSYVASIPALIFFSAIVLIVGLVARNFREANSFATPTMLLPLGSMAVGIAEPAATPAILLTPVANTTVIIREVLTGRATFAAFALAFVSSCLYAAIVLSFAARVFRSEQLVNPSWEPVSLKGLRGKRNKGERRLPPVDAAMGLFVTSLLLQFYLGTLPPKNLAEHRVPPLIPLVLVTQLGLIFGMMATGMTGSPWGLVGTFVGMRALCDACIAGLQGFVKRRDLPAGLARFLARRSKQSVESLEAEFDALKRDGAEVEALLERPIGEVHRP